MWGAQEAICRFEALAVVLPPPRAQVQLQGVHAKHQGVRGGAASVRGVQKAICRFEALAVVLSPPRAKV